jgi:hypothetical protein
MKTLLPSRCLTLSGLIGLFALAPSRPLLACPACYGDTTGSKMGNAATWGIIAMTIIMFAMLGAVGAFIWHLAYRAKHPLPDYNELLNESKGKPKPGASS